MSPLPIAPLSPEQQRKIMGQMYRLLGKQVQSYHKFHHMGSNSSIPTELARDLAESVDYTVSLAGGMYADTDLEQTFLLGQEVLRNKLSEAENLLKLVRNTAPQWQTECRWEALRYLESFLISYDYQHLSHIGPDGLFYPILIAPPEELRGIECCIFYLKVMWIENRIMASVSEETLEGFWDRLPSGALNQCEQLLLNGLGKAVLEAGLDSLLLSPEECFEIGVRLRTDSQGTLYRAALRLCEWLDLTDEGAQMYIRSAASQLEQWRGADLRMVFL